MLATQWKVVIAVDEDVDPWDANQVLWAISARCRPDIDVLMIPSFLHALTLQPVPMGLRRGC